MQNYWGGYITSEAKTSLQKGHLKRGLEWLGIGQNGSLDLTGGAKGGTSLHKILSNGEFNTCASSLQSLPC